MMSAKINLSNYDISERWGFLGDCSQTCRLGGPFIQWEDLLDSLPYYIQSKRLRAEIKTLPELELSDATLKNMQEWKQAYVLLSFIGQAYLRMDDELPDKLPQKLAKPWEAASRHLGLKPFVSYAALILYNCHVSDEVNPLNTGNISARNSFTGLDDESWFYRVHMAAEIAAAPGINAISHTYHHMACNDNEAVTRCLEEVIKSLDRMREESSQLCKQENGTLKCKPDAFYKSIRPFCSGLSNGIIYEGMDDPQPRQYHGASGAQTSSIYAFGIFLGVKHSGEESDFTIKMREYMPRGHRNFLDKLDTMPSVRLFCKISNNQALISSYNKAVESLLNFRIFHLKKLICEFIFGPKMRAEARCQAPQGEQTSQNQERGTGGTKLSTFLQKIVEETKELTIHQVVHRRTS